MSEGLVDASYSTGKPTFNSSAYAASSVPSVYETFPSDAKPKSSYGSKSSPYATSGVTIAPAAPLSGSVQASHAGSGSHSGNGALSTTPSSHSRDTLAKAYVSPLVPKHTATTSNPPYPPPRANDPNAGTYIAPVAAKKGDTLVVNHTRDDHDLVSNIPPETKPAPPPRSEAQSLYIGVPQGKNTNTLVVNHTKDEHEPVDPSKK